MVDECIYCGLDPEDCVCDEPVKEADPRLLEDGNAFLRDYREEEEWLMRNHYAQTQHQNDQNR